MSMSVPILPEGVFLVPDVSQLNKGNSHVGLPTQPDACVCMFAVLDVDDGISTTAGFFYEHL